MYSIGRSKRVSDFSKNAIQSWIYDPSSGLFRTVTPSGTEQQADLPTLSNGRLSQRGTTIYNKSNGRIVWNIPPTRLFQVTPLESGALLLSNEVTEEDVNSDVSTASQYTSAFSTELSLPDGTMQRVEIPFVSLTAIGEKAYVNRAMSGPSSFINMAQGINPDTGLPYEIPPGYDLASVDELSERAIIGYLFKHYRSLLDDMVASGMENEEGIPFDTPSDAAAFLYRTGAFDVAFARTGFFGG